ncbi:MAG: GAF domain-containing protein, partial [Calditrichaeota bacterium]|nr:GAF domain-containing protein [Calditrichota bacterium]
MTKSSPEFPFTRTLSIQPLINFILNDKENGIPSEFVEQIKRDIEARPILKSDSISESELRKHGELVEKMLSVALAPAFKNKNLFAAVAPFNYEGFYISNAFKTFMGKKTNFKEFIQFENTEAVKAKFMAAYIIVLRQFYNIDLHFERPSVISFHDPETQTTKYFRLRAFPTFMTIKAVKTLPKLSQKQINQLIDNADDLKIWQKLLPPDLFEASGFMILDAVDITDLEIMSLLKHDLIESINIKKSLMDNEIRDKVQTHIRNLLKKPELQMGIIFLSGSKLNEGCGHAVGSSILFNENFDLSDIDMSNSAYQRIIDENKPFIFSDLDDESFNCPVLQRINAAGIKNLYLAPINYDGKLIGMLEIGSPNARDINAINALKLENVFMLFSNALKRGYDEFHAEMQKLIKEKCTAIHPSVEWRFQEAAFEYLKKKKSDPGIEMEEIVFDNVYPLYAVSDIRNSSTTRNSAIQSDLIEQLELAKDIMEQAYQVKELPYLDEIRYRLDNSILHISKELNTGDELSTLEFLKNEVEPTFKYLKDINSAIKLRINNYLKVIDNKHGILYKQRKNFEQSVNAINDTISTYLEHQEEKSQKMFPHYFERYKTDGVEHSMYIGATLVQNRPFDKLYLKNLRLWQLMTQCVIVKKCHDLKSQLQMPLDTAHLILVQDMPLSIRFRMDEKHFDVDGAYNIRYEMLKKRIDKARIRNSDERLTQPDHIAVVYTQFKEAEEYRKYLDYLKSIDYIEDNIEDLELEYLQGIHGLRALRVKVKPML